MKHQLFTGDYTVVPTFQARKVPRSIYECVHDIAHDIARSAAFVRAASGRRSSCCLQLIQATRKDFPASYFELPSGYTPATNANTFNRTFQK